MQKDIFKEVVNLQIRYSPEVDALIIKLKEGRPVDSIDISENIILHFTKKKEPLEIEILDASKFVALDDIDVSWKELLNKRIKAPA